MSRQQRRQEERARQRRRQEKPGPAAPPRGPRPWYFRYGYHLGVWSGVMAAAGFFAIFRDAITALIIGIIFGQVAGILLSRMGR